jgi:hypothetical protein
MPDIGYACPRCGKRIVVPKVQPAPKCCGMEMAADPLPYCTKIPNAEMARETDADEPCADGTRPKKS